MNEREVLAYPRFVQNPSGSATDRSSVIARFMVGQDFCDRTSEAKTVYIITRIDHEGIWGIEREESLEPSK
jgi:hypothetical protein